MGSLVRSVTCIALCATLAGCGGESSVVAGPGPSSVSAAGPASSQRIGQIYLGAQNYRQAAGASISVAGTDVKQVVADSVGAFRLPQLPPGAVVRARLTNGMTLEAVDDGSNWLWISPGTTFVSRYLAAHPQESRSSAEARVRQYLRVPGSVDLGRGLEDTWRSPFSWTTFLQAAGNHPQGFLEQQVARVGTGQTVSFRAPAPYPNLYRALHGALPNSVPSASPQPLAKGALVAADDDDDDDDGDGESGSLMGAVFTNFVEGGISLSIMSKAIGWVTNALGIGAGSQEQQELEEIITDLETMQLQTAQNQAYNVYTSAISDTGAGSAVTNISTIQTAWQNDVNTNNGFGAANTLSTYAISLQQDLGSLSKFVLGGSQNSPGVTLYAIAIEAVYGNSSPEGANLMLDIRTNSIIDSVQAMLDYYTGYMNTAATLLAEWGHQDPGILGLTVQTGSGSVLANSNTYVSNLQAAASYLQNTTGTIVQAQQLVPPAFASGDVLVDCENQLMWYLPAYDVGSYSGAGPAAEFLNVPGVAGPGEWSVPSESQLQTLRTLALAADPSSVNQGLINLGFYNIPTSGDFEVWDSDGREYSFSKGQDISQIGSSDENQLLVVRQCPTSADTNQTLAATSNQVSGLGFTGSGTQSSPLISQGNYPVRNSVPTINAAYYTTNNGSLLSVFNVPGLGGVLTPLSSAVGSFTEAFCITLSGSAGGGLITRNITTQSFNSPITGGSPTLQAVLITPANSTVSQNSLNGSNPSAAQLYCYATALYSNNTFADVTNSTTWSVNNSTAFFTNNGQGGIQSEGNELNLPQTLGQSTLTITANYNGANYTGTVSTTFVTN